MKSLLILPFLIMKSLSVPFHEHTQLIDINNNNITKICIKDKHQYKHLNSTLIDNKLMSINKDVAKYIHIETDQNKLCGLKVTKNKTSGDFIFDYDSFPMEVCSNYSNHNIICDNPETHNCSMAVKCCDIKSNPCTNEFRLTKITMNDSMPIIADDGVECTRNNSTDCFALEQQIHKPSTTENPNNSQDHAVSRINYLLHIMCSITPYLLSKQ